MAGDAHPQLRRHDVELFAAQLADRMQQAAVARAVAALDVDQHFIARQVGREVALVTVGARLPVPPLFVLRKIRRVPPSPVLRQVLLQILQSQPQLIGAQLFGAAAELTASQALDQQPQFVVLGLIRLHHTPQSRVLLFGCGHRRAQHVLQHCGVFEQGREVDFHSDFLADAVPSRLMNLA